MESSKQAERLQISEHNDIEVSYTLFALEHDKGSIDELIQKIATSINVQLALEEGNQKIPFIPFNGFDNVQHDDKLLLYGPSGCGKSRGIFEIIKRTITDEKKKEKGIKNIYIITPRHTLENEPIKRAKLYELVNKFNNNDIVIWDNFPDGLLKKDLDSAQNVLEILSSKNVESLFVALKPKYLEMYRDIAAKTPEIYKHELSYDKQKIKDILKWYGTDIASFKVLYEKDIANNLDKIAKILWQKEPTPLTVLDYYRELSSNTSVSSVIQSESESIEKKALNAISTAEKLLLSTDYYEHQFAAISSSEERLGDAEFLYTLKLCYELELKRTIDVIRVLQKEIFGSVSPKDPLQKLTTWLYLSGQYYSMHDLCKDAIKFNDDVKLKIITHLTDDFMNILPTDEDSSAYSFGTFYGKNFEFVPHNDASNPFLPAHVYRYMKGKRYFEKGLAHGIGEIFPILDGELQEQILRRIEIDEEFAESFGESIGDNFASLDEMQQKQILFECKTKSAPFANGLGEGLGHNLKTMSPELEKKILELSSTDAMFTQGIGKGLGRNFKNLSNEFQKKVLAWAEGEFYASFREGLGIGIGRSFAYLDKQLQQEILKWAETNREFGQGLGYGLGYDFPTKDKQIQEKIFAVAGQNFQFASGLAAALGFNFKYLDRRVQEDLLKRVEKDHSFANGLGDGFGMVFLYLDKEMQLEILTQAKRNGAIAWGLGQSLGRRFKYTPKEFQKELFRLAEKNIEFTRGFAMGLGDAFSELDNEVQKELFDKAEKDSEFAFGLGAGIGIWHMDNELWIEVLAKAKAKKNSQFARGLAQSLVIYSAFLDKEHKEMVLELAEKDSEFAFGWGRGFGIIFMTNSRNDVSEQSRRELFERLEINSQFARGLGSALGLHFQYLSVEFREELFILAEQNIEFAYGLGDGLGRAFTYLEETLQRDLLRLAEQNVQFAIGLGSGLGYSFMYLKKQFQENVFELAEQNVQFAQGLGEGLGNGFNYLAEDIQTDLLEKIAVEGRDSAFARGFGECLGRNFPYLSKAIQAKVFRKAEENIQLRIGLGCGFGLVFPYLHKELQIKIFEKAESAEEDGYAKGLGIGLGRIFKYLGTELQSEIFEYVKGLQYSQYVRGLGFGFGLQFKYLNKEVQDTIFEDAEKNAHLAEGLGYGIGYTFPYLGERLQEEAFAKLLEPKKEANGSSLAHGLGKGIAYILAYLPPQIHLRIILNTNQNKEFAKGLGEGLGHIFPSLKEEIQEEVLLWIDESASQQFTEGVGVALGGSFKYLEDILQQEILLSRLMEKEIGFIRGLAFGLGNNFPCLNEKLQNDLLVYAQNNNEFANGLGFGLIQSFKYLNSELQTQILALAERSEQFTKGLQERDNVREIARVSQTYDDFPIIGSGLRWKSNPACYDYSNKTVASTEQQEISFLGLRENYCICYIDMMNSTKIAAELNNVQISKYYATFLNSMAIIARNFGAKIIKNAGDCLIFYFPQTSLTNASTNNTNNNTNKDNNNNSNNRPSAAFKDVVECCLTMIAAHRAINAKLHLEQLPPLNYRISADYGKVEIAKSATSQSEDFFGSTMNICAKINSKAAPNGIVVGNNLYLIISSLESNENKYTFEKVGEYSGFQDTTSSYPVYSVQSKHTRTILNPFKRASHF
jgi:class 3 adenylate cyclase